MKEKKFLLRNITAWIVIVCLLFNIMPVNIMQMLSNEVSAVGFDVDSNEMTVYEIENGSIQETINRIALKATEDNPCEGKVVLDKDYTENLLIPDLTTIVIDLNGYHIRPVLDGESESQIVVNGTLKVTDSVENSTGSLVSDSTSDIRAVSISSGGRFIFENAVIDNYYSSGNGAGIKVEDNGYLNFMNATIKNCGSDLQGGGIFAFNAKDVDLTGGEITGNNAKNGGGIYFYRTKDISADAVYSITGTSVDNNTAEESGGGIYIDNTIYMELDGAVLDNNTAKNNGGGICFERTAYLTVNSGSSISGNTSNLGGGVYFYAATTMEASSFTLNGGRINRNKSAGNGGGIYFNRSLSLSNERTSVVINSGEMNENTSGANGGGISLYFNSDFTINGGSINNNSAYTHGGGVYMECNSTVSVFTMNGGTVNENTLTGAFNIDRHGGGVYVGAYSKVELKSGEISVNTKATHGGGIFIGGASNVSICDGMKISDNEIYKLNGNTYGAGLFLDSNAQSSLTMTGGEISGNYGTVGNNTYGGGIYLGLGKVDISGGKILNNKVKNNGGGIYMTAPAKLSGSLIISGNSANSGGGGIYSERPIELNGDVIIENNTTPGRGGGIYDEANSVGESGATIEIKGNVKIRNNAAGTGGGIFGGHYSYTNNNHAFVMMMKGGEITNNTATSGAGGIYIRCNQTQYFTGGKITDNKAAGNGGGLYIERNLIQSSDGKEQLGGAPSIEVSYDMLISGNTAGSNGGGIFLTNMVRLELGEGGRIINNTAATNGGGVYISQNSNYDFTDIETGEKVENALEITGGELHDNVAVLGKDLYSHGPNTAVGYNTPYISVSEPLTMDNAFPNAYWLDETNGEHITTSFDNKSRVQEGVAPIYSAYTFNNTQDNVAEVNDTLYQSVQEAVDAVAAGEVSGDIVMLKSSRETVIIPEGAKVSLDLNGFTLYGEVSSVITVNEGAEFTLKDSDGEGKITDGKGKKADVKINSTDGSAVFVLGGKFVMESGTISGNRYNYSNSGSNHYGSAVYVENGTFEMTGGSIENNLSNNKNEGCVVLIRNSNLIMKDALIANNQSRGIYINNTDSNLTARIENTEISGNLGYAVYMNSSAGGTTIERCRILNNISPNNYNNGAIHINSGVVSVKGTLIKGNASARGAGVYLNGGTVHLDSCEITNNTAKSGYGGGVYVTGSNRHLYLNNTKIYENVAASATGGSDIRLDYHPNGTFFYSESDGYDSRAVENWGLDGYDCWIDEETGDYYVDDASKYNSDNFINIESMFLDDEHTSISRTLNLKATKSAYSVEPVAEITQTGVKYSTLGSAIKAASDITGNVEIRLLKDTTERIIVSNSSAEIKLDLCGHTITAPVFAPNVIFVTKGGVLTVSDSGSGGKIVPADDEKYDISMTRGVYINGGKFTLEGGEISGFNFSGDGAGIYRNGLYTESVIQYDSELYINGGTIRDNTATGNGGGISAVDGSKSNDVLEVSGGVIAENTAQNGGGIYYYAANNNNTVGQSEFIISGGLFDNNTATATGGGIYFKQRYYQSCVKSAVYGCKITNNYANSCGGIYAENVSNPENTGFRFGNEDIPTVVSGNSTKTNYAGIYVFNNNINDASKIIVTNAEIFDNVATTQYIAVFTANNVIVSKCNYHNNSANSDTSAFSAGAANLHIKDSEFHDNYSYTNAGGLYLFTFSSGTNGAGEKLVENCKIYNNSVNGYGGGIWDSNAYDVTYKNCEIYGNTAITAGGVCFYAGSANIDDTVIERQKNYVDCYIHDNTTITHGGGIYSYNASKLRIILENGTKVSGNTCGSNGGGIYIPNTGVTIEVDNGSVISGNKAVTGGGISLEYGNLEINGGIISENKATTGAGINFYTRNDSAYFKMSSGEIRDNVATGNGGAFHSTTGNSGTEVEWFDAIEFTGGKIYNNKANYGAGLFLRIGNSNNPVRYKNGVSITGTEITGNYATTDGGGIYVDHCVDKVNVSGTAVVTGNTAGNYGGGVFINYKDTGFNYEGGKLYNNTAMLGNDAYIAYSGSYRSSDLSLMNPYDIFGDTDDYTATAWYEEVDGASYTDSVRVRPLLKSYGYTLNYKYKDETVIAVFDGKEYSSVQAAIDALESSGKKSDKEVIMVSDSVESVTIGSGSDIILNLNGHTLKSIGSSTITNRGTLEIVDDKKTVQIGDKKYVPGEGTGTITGSAAKAGGGIHILSGKVTLTSGEISGCKAGAANTGTGLNAANNEYGGAAVGITSGEFVLAGGTIRNNTALRGSAVLVQTVASIFTMQSGVIEDNVSSDSAVGTSTAYGAIFNNGGKVDIYGGTIQNNQAKYGAAIFNYLGKLSVVGENADSRPEIKNNTAGTSGGAIYINGGEVITEYVVISGNKTTDPKGVNVNTTNATNGLLASAGGGIFFNSGNLNIGDGTVIEGNSAVRGGGVYQYNGTAQIFGADTRITGNRAQLGGGVAQCPIPGNATTSMTMSDSASVYGNVSTLTAAGNDFYSAWEGSNTYQSQLGNHAEYTPQLNLLAAANMSVGEKYNVWKNDTYNGTQRTGSDLLSGQYVTAEISMGIDVQVTAAHYNTDVTSIIDSNYYVENMDINSIQDGSGVFDDGSRVTKNYNLDDATDTEISAKQLLDDGRAVELAETYEYNGSTFKYIEYNGKKYEQNQAVEWWPGDDSENNNRIIRSFDEIVYELHAVYHPDSVDLEQESYSCRLCIMAVLPCSSEDATFVQKSSGLSNYLVVPSQDAEGNPIQILTGYWPVTIVNDGSSTGNIYKNLSVSVSGMKNGSLLKPTFECWFFGNEHDPVSCESETVTVSAAPKYNVTLLNNSELAFTSNFDMVGGVEVPTLSDEDRDNENIVTGTMLGFGVTLELYNDPNVKGLKGLEVPDGDIEFDISFKGRLYGKGEEIEGATSAPLLWAYKENNISKYGRNLSSSADIVNMSWDDDDELNKHSHFAYKSAPFNTGSNSWSCFNGGGWTITGVESKENETTFHMKVSGYSISNATKVTQNSAGASSGAASSILGSGAVYAFSAGYIQIILPLTGLDENNLNNGFYEVNMNSVASKLDVTSSSGQKPDEVKSATDLYDDELVRADLSAMNEYYLYTDPEELRTGGYAVNERRYADNFANVSTGLNITKGDGIDNRLHKYNIFMDESFDVLNGINAATDDGSGDTPLNSTVYIQGGVDYVSNVIDTTDEKSKYYAQKDEKYSSELFKPIEYNYLTALNILQKFDADAYTPVGVSEPVISVPNTQLAGIVGDSFRISTSETQAEWSSTATTGYELTILYAAKPDGTNWAKAPKVDTEVTPNINYDDGGSADMDKYKEENLLFFETLDDLHNYFASKGNDNAVCVAILYEFRKCCIRTGRSVSASAKMNVTGEFEKVGQTYCTTNDVRGWLTYRPYFKYYYLMGTSTVADNTFTFSWHDQISDTVTISDEYETTRDIHVYGYRTGDGNTLAAGTNFSTDPTTRNSDLYKIGEEISPLSIFMDYYSAGYVKTRYRNGVRLANTHSGSGGRENGNTLLLYSLDTSVKLNVATTWPGSEKVKQEYNVSNGERDVQFRVTPEIGIASSAKKTELVKNGTQATEVTIALKIPKGLNYVNGSMFIDYNSDGCEYEEGSMKWVEEVVINDDGTQTVYLRTYVSDIEKTLPEVFFDCIIGDEKNPQNDIQSNTSLTVTAEISTKYSERDIMAADTHRDTTSITAEIESQDGITKSTDSHIVEVGEDITFSLIYANSSGGQGVSNVQMVDVMPHNNDGRNTAFTGGYRIKRVAVEFTSTVGANAQADYNAFLKNSGGGIDGVLYFGSNKTTWKSTYTNDELNGIITDVTENNVTTDEVIKDVANCTITYDFSAVKNEALIAKAFDGEGNVLEVAPVLYAKIPQVSQESRVVIDVVVTPMNVDIDNTLIESGDGISSEKTQTGGNKYDNCFYYERGKTTGSTDPLTSNIVSVSVIKRIISGTVWMDQDQDGMYNTQESVDNNNKDESNPKKTLEYPIKNIKATLYYVDKNGKPDTSNFPVKDTIGNNVEPVYTDEHGNYSFENIGVGNYTIVFTEDGDREYEYMLSGKAHPTDFGMLSVTTSEHASSIRGNKCCETYDSTGANLINGTILPTITLPDKYSTPAVYTSPNWDLGLYYIDFAVEKQWENMKSGRQVTGVPEGMSAVFDIVGTDVNGAKVYNGTLTLEKISESNIKVTYEDTNNKTGNAVTFTITEEQVNDIFEWKFGDSGIYLQAENADGNITYTFRETDIKLNNESVWERYRKSSELMVDEVTHKYTLVAVNSQILGSITIVKKTGGGDPLEGAWFSIYQVKDKETDKSKVYTAQEGIGKKFADPYDEGADEDLIRPFDEAKIETKNYYKVILGTEENLGSMNSDTVKCNSESEELKVIDTDGNTVTYKLHKEQDNGETVYYYYAEIQSPPSFKYEWTLGGSDDFKRLVDAGTVDINDNFIDSNDYFKFDNKRCMVNVRQNSEGEREYYIEVTVSPEKYSKVAIVEFINLPFYDSDGNYVYYTVRETGYPDGYISLGNFNSLTGVDLYNDGADNQHDFCYEVENTRQMELPVTGGSGLSTVVIIGSMLFSLCGAYLVLSILIRKRKRGERVPKI